MTCVERYARPRIDQGRRRREARVLRDAYDQLRPADFSADFLARGSIRHWSFRSRTYCGAIGGAPSA